MAKGCSRCINIHTSEAQKLGADDREINQGRKVALFLKAFSAG